MSDVRIIIDVGTEIVYWDQQCVMEVLVMDAKKMMNGKQESDSNVFETENDVVFRNNSYMMEFRIAIKEKICVLLFLMQRQDKFF